MTEDKLKTLYSILKEDGYDDIGTEEQFRDAMKDKGKVNQLFSVLKNDGYDDIGNDENAFYDALNPVASTSETLQPAQQSVPQQPSTEQPWKPTEKEKAAMMTDLQRIGERTQQTVDRFNESVDNIQEYGLNPGLQTKESKMQFNQDSGKVEKTYLTPAGNRYDNKSLAYTESFRYRQAADMSIGGQLRKANLRLSDIEERMEARGRELLEEHQRNKPGGFAGFFQEMANIQAGDRMGGATVENPEDHTELQEDSEYQSLRLAARKAREEIQQLQNAKDKEQHGERFWHDFLRNTWQSVADVDAWDFGMNKLRDAHTMLDIAGKAEVGAELNEAETDALYEMYLHNNIMEQFGDLGRGARWGDITGGSLSFMKDFLLTGGFSGVGTKLPTTLSTKVATKAATRAGVSAAESLGVKVAKEGLFSTVRQGGKKVVSKLLAEQGVGGVSGILATKALGVTAEDLLIRAPLMATTIQGQAIAAKIIDSKLGPVIADPETGILQFSDDKSWGEAAWQTGADQVIENFSEMWGAHLPGMADVTKTFGARNLTAALLRATRPGAGTIMSKTTEFLGRAGVNGYFGEVGEEYYGQLWRTMLNLDSAYGMDKEGNKVNNFMTSEFHGDIWGGMALSIGLTGGGIMALNYAGKGMEKAYDGAKYTRYKHEINKADARAAEMFTPEVWEGMRTIIDASDNSDMGNIAAQVMADTEMTDVQRGAVMDYMEKSMIMRGHNLREYVSRKNGDVPTYDEEEMSQSYIDGYNVTGSQEMNDAKNMYDYQRERMKSELGVNDEALEGDAVDWLHEARNARDAGTEQGRKRADIIMDYVNAKQVRDGMMQRVRDGIDAQVEQSNAMIDARVNRKTGMIQGATMKQDDRRVYVLNGNLIPYADGSGIDLTESDNSIIIRDADTGMIEQVSPEAILSIDDVQDPYEQKELAEQAIVEQFAREAADKIDGVATFNPGDTYTISGENASQAQVQVVANEQGIVDNGDGTVNVSDGVNIFPIAKETIQQQVDVANIARVAEFEKQRALENGQSQEELETNSPEYTPDYSVTLRDAEGNIIHGTIAYKEGDETFVVDVDKPIDGKHAPNLTRQELNEIVVSVADESGQVVWERPSTEKLPENENKIVEESPEMAQGDSNVLEEGMTETGTSEVRKPTAMERIPKDEQGNPLYEQADADDAFDAIMEEAGGESDIAAEILADIVKEKEAVANAAQKALKKAQEAKPEMRKGSAPPTIQERIAAKKAAKEAVSVAQSEADNANATLALWQKIAQTPIRRKQEADAESRRVAEEAAAQRKVEEERMRAEREEAERIEREALNGVPDIVDDIPQDARARGYRRVSGHKIDRPEPLQGLQGKEVAVKFGDGIVPTGRVVVIEAEQLQPSHLGGVRNPAHFIDEAQPKERNDEASVLSARKIAGNIRPEEITSSVTAYTGAPTVNARGEAIQGNNRSDALRQMWEGYQDQAAKYKQYLKEHAQEFGLNVEDIDKMQHPVLVNMLDVDDAEAISLGQFVAQDTESGGMERIKPKNAVQKMGADMRSFANLLLKSTDEEISFAGLVDSNGVDVLRWMSQRGYITPTQYKSAFDSKGNITSEAKNDLRGIMYQSIFKDGSTRLEEMFNALPVKAQRAILATAFRDYDSSNSERMVDEIQNSIRVYYALSQDKMFAEAKNFKETRIAIENWKRQYQMDDVTGESYLPADNFSNFALHLAAMYKGESQSFIQSTFNKLYDLIQGTQESNLFEQPDNTPRTLVQAIKEILNLDYDGQQRSNVLVGDTSTSQRGRQGSNGDAATGERVESGERLFDSAGRVTGSSRRSGTESEDRGDKEKENDETEVIGRSMTADEAQDFIADMELDAEIAPEIDLTIENWDDLFGEDGIVSTPIGEVKMGENQFTKLIRQGRNGKLGMIKPTLEHPHAIIEDASEAKEGDTTERTSSYVFIRSFKKADGSRYYYFTSITVSKDGKEVVVSNQEKRRNAIANLLTKGKLVWKHADNVSNASDMAQGLYSSQGNVSDLTTEGTDAPQTTMLSESKDSKLSLKSNELGEKIIAAEKEIDPNPTEAQKEAGNYKKGHVQIGTFNVTIENPKGSVRSGIDAEGNKWETTMHNTYGYIRGTEGVDGDHIDVFLSDDIDGWNGHKVFVVDQYNEDGTFDEHKVMLGFNEADDAEAAYFANYDRDWAKKHKTVVTGVNLEEFEKWIESSHRKTKAFSEYKSVKTIKGQSSGTQGDRLSEIKSRIEELHKEQEATHNRSDIFEEARIISEINDLFTEQRKLEQGVSSEEATTPPDAPYTITPAQYTTKRGKVLDMHLVRFETSLSKEQQQAAQALAKSLKGWYDREQRGFMMRSEEDAGQLVNNVMPNDEATPSVTQSEAKESTIEKTLPADEDIFQMAERIAKEDEKRKRQEKSAGKVDNTGKEPVSLEQWKRMDGGERMAEAERQPLTREEIENAPTDEILRANALNYLDGNQGMVQGISYLKNYEDVRYSNGNSTADSGTADKAQLDETHTGSQQELDGTTGGARRVSSELLDSEQGEGAVFGLGGHIQHSSDSEERNVADTGKGGDISVSGEKQRVGGQPVRSGERGGSRDGGGHGRNGKQGGRGRSNQSIGNDRKRRTETKRGRDSRDGGSQSIGEDLDAFLADAMKEFDSVLEEFKRAGKEELSASFVGMSNRQMEVLPRLIVAGAKVGYAYIKKGVHNFAEWAKQMRKVFGDKLADAGLGENEIDAYIREMWKSKLPMDGKTHTIEEWASILGKEELRSKISTTFEEKRKAQQEAESVPVKTCDRENIAATLPFLFPQQQDDVLKAETQFFDESHNDREHAFGKGYMFTNGTGTGKTYTGLGIVKRFIKQGKGRILILTPSQTKVTDWIKDAGNLDIELNDLDKLAKAREDGTTATTEKGEGAVITTFANFRQNQALLEDEFDLIVYDECHRLLENKEGAGTTGANQHYKISNRNENFAFLRLQDINPAWRILKAKEKEFDDKRATILSRLQKENGVSNELTFELGGELPPSFHGNWDDNTERKFPEIANLRKEIIELNAKYNKNVKPELEQQAKESVKRTKVVFLSATPFNTRDNLEYAEGYIFSYPEREKQDGYSVQSPRSQFYLEHFGAGYKWRYHRLENSGSNPEAVSKQEVEFSNYLQHTLQTMSGRIIDSPYDYSRDFPTVTLDKAEEFNNAMEELAHGGATGHAYYTVMGDYNYTSALFESMKVGQIIPRLKEHLARGRKAVIFHRRVESKNPIVPPFRAIFTQAVKDLEGEYDVSEKEKKRREISALRRKYANMLKWERTLDLRMPREQLADAFGKDEVLFFSGKESKKVKDKAVADFNNDDSGKNIIVIQETSGKEGISLHDTTGNHQRVLVTLALPQSPITALQIEGRIYRIGNKSNAIFEYPLLGLNTELMLFGQKFNQQVSTTENLALGSQARNLRESFARGVEEHSGNVDINSQGVGGKEFDAPIIVESNPFDNAVLDYYTNQKLTGKRDNREGIDYYPTPEPLGFMLNQWGHISEGESVLEPSAGHGAIARYVPRENPLTAIEPSQGLFSRLQIKAGGNGRKFENTMFENYNVVNKHDVVLMNPPFGMGGRLAVDHVAKAFQHLEEGGRIVAIIPRGSTDKKFDKWYDEQKNATLTAEIGLPDIVFERAGTSVSCRVVVIDKITNETLRSDAASRAMHIDLGGQHYEKIEDFFEEIRDISVPERTIDQKAKLKKKAVSAARELRTVKNVKDALLTDEGIKVTGRGVWASINWGDRKGDALTAYLSEEYRRFKDNYDYALRDGQETREIVYGEMKALACKLAGMTEDEMQRYISQKAKDDTLYRSDDTMYRIREDAAPKNIGIGYKVFVLKNGELYPPMVANPNGDATPVGVWLDADAAPIAGQSKTGRSQVRAGGKGTQGGSGKLAYRPGWHLGIIPYALQFNRNDENGEKTLFPANFVWAEVEYANDVNYQEEAMSYGYNQNGKFQHSYAGLPRVPENGAYTYRTNPNPETDPWIITGAMRVKRLLTPTEVDEMVKVAGRIPQRRQENAVTDAEIIALNENFARDYREGVGAYTDEEISYENAPTSKMLGKPRGTAKQRREFAQRERQRMVERVENLTKKLHLDNVDIVTDSSILEGKKQRAKGFFSKSTGKITIVIPNHTSMFDVEQTLLHEAVAHYGLRELFGEHFDTFLDNVFNNADENIRKRIVDLAAKNSWDFGKATEEYLAMLAENMEFENTNASWWRQIKNFFLKMLHKIGFENFSDVTLTDNELRYILWRSYENLADPGKYRSILGEATDVAKQYELRVGRYNVSGEQLEIVAESDDNLYRDGDPEIHERVLARNRYEQRVRSGMYQTQEALQDSMLGLKEAMSAILGPNKYIEDVDGFENAYLGENRLSSVNKAEADAFAWTLFKPLLDEVSKLAHNETERDELTDYMMAKHGVERNRVMAERDAQKDFAENQKQHPKSTKTLQDFIDEYRNRDYAGLTALTGMDEIADAESEAQALVDEYENMHDTAGLWDKVNAVSKAILQKSYECGMMNKETFDNISNMYEFYIPLRGFDEKTSSDAYAYLTDKHSAFNAPIKKAEGRKSKADDPFANLQSMAESAIMQGNRNKIVKQRFFNFVLNHPSDLVSVSDLWLEHNPISDEWNPVFPDNLDVKDTPEEVERKLQEFEEKMQQLSETEPDKYKHGKETVNIPYRVVENRDLRQHQVVVKRNGRDYVLTINGNPRAAQALNGQTNPDNDTSGAIGVIIRAGEKINRQLSAFYTTRNPDFIASNFMRDMLYTNTMVWIKENPNYALRFHRNYVKANPAVMKRLLAKHRKGTLDMNDKAEAMFHQFIMNGGETGYANIRDIEQHKNDIRKELKMSNGKLPIKKALSLLGERFDELNRAVENCARFAVFMTSREMGRSMDRAIYDAKEISVNFNKKGSGAKFYDTAGQTKAGNVSALISGLGRSGYVFWNAAIQGTTNFGKQAKRHPAKAFTGAAAMFLLGTIIAYLGGDDDDDDKNAYYNLPEYVRRSNILFSIGEHWISIPLPVEYRAFYGMGELMTSTLNGKEHLTETEIAEAIAGQVTQILPIDFLEGEGGLNAFVPSAAKPVWEAFVVKKSWTGMPLYKDTPYNIDMPEWTKAYKSANKHIVGLANALNEATGGDPYTKGTIDLNPAKIEYILNGYFGGVFGTIDKLSKTAETITGMRDYDPRSILILNRLTKAGDERTEYRAINNEYFRLKEEHDRLKKRLKHYEEDTDNGIFDYADKIDFLYNSPEYERYEIFENYQSDIDDLYNELKETVDEEERKDIEAELNEVRKEMIREMNQTRKRK